MIKYSINNINSDVFDRLKYRIETCQLITNMLNSSTDFLIYGAPGCGKTTLIRELLKGYDIKHIRINCIQAQSKIAILQKITQSFQKEFNYRIKECSKLRNFIQEIKELSDFLLQTNIQEGFNFRDQTFYLILDNFDKIDVSSKFTRQLLQIKQVLKINFSIIFIGVNLPETDILDNYAMSLVPQYMIPQPCKNFQYDMLMEYLKDRVQLYQEKRPFFVKVYNKIGKEIASNIVQIFGKLIVDLGQLIHVTWQIYQVVCIMGENVTQVESLLTCRQFKAVKKLLVENPLMCEGNIDVLIKKVEDLLLKNDQQLLFEKQRGITINLPKIPAIILISCWIGNRNQERTDKKLFKERKFRGRKQKRLPKSIEEGRKMKPIKLQRLIALSDSLLSLYMEELEENENYDRSFDFYQQIAVLEQHQFLSKSSKKSDALGQIKYVCNLEQATIKNIAQQYNINIYMHLTKDQ